MSANLAVLKTPTVMRLEDGSFYGWEGLHETAGSCEGSCTARLELRLRPPLPVPQAGAIHARNWMSAITCGRTGGCPFASSFPWAAAEDGFHPCVDGQMGGVIKTYREWKLCGDDDWLRSLWPQVKLALEYAWSPANPYRWDGNKDGVLEGRQHHTLDMELYGPNAWLQGLLSRRPAGRRGNGRLPGRGGNSGRVPRPV
ncbi:MAG: GH116 family glycosyl hydrolase [Oscillospiraceae bacterium]